MSVFSAADVTYDEHGRLLRHTHADLVGRDILYIVGDEDTDGSIRLIVDEISNVASIEEREQGVWNAGELQLSKGSLIIGREVRLSAIGDHLLVSSPDNVTQAIVLDQSYDDTGSGPPQSLTVGPLISRVIRQADNSTELTLTDHSSFLITFGQLLTTAVYVQIGSTGASAEVSVVFTEGVPPNDVIFFTENFPASKFPTNSEVFISEMFPGVTFGPDIRVNGFFSSPTAFTMRYDAAEDFLWFALDVQQQAHEDILTESFILSNDLDIVFTNDAELVRDNEVFE